MTANEFIACYASKTGIIEISFGEMTFGQRFFMYIKSAHVELIPSMRSYVREFMSRDASGTEGYLSSLGLIPLLPADHTQEARKAILLKPLTVDELNPR